jgi:hypothetical protein
MATENPTWGVLRQYQNQRRDHCVAGDGQNPYAERLIGSMRRECLDHVIVLGERHLRRVLTAYLTYYHGSRLHLSLEKDAPTPRPVHHVGEGAVSAFREVGGLHHRYERRAA